MPKEILVKPEAGQEVVINPVGDVKIASARISTSKAQARVIVAGTYVEPPPPEPEPEPEPEPVGIPVPVTIDKTGATNAQPALQAFLASVPDGSAISFPADGIYRLDTALLVQNRSNLTFLGNGCTLRSGTGQTGLQPESLIYLGGLPIKPSTGIVVRGFNLIGNSPTPGVFIPVKEHAHGVCVLGGGQVEIDDVTVSGTYGDGFCVNGGADGVRIHHCTVASTGRNGVSVIAGSNVTVEHSEFTVSGYSTFDIEPWTSGTDVRNISFRDTTAGTNTNSWLSGNGNDGTTIDGVEFVRNTIRGPAGAASGPIAQPGTGGTFRIVMNKATPRRQNVVVTDNVATRAYDYKFEPVAYLENIDHLTFQRNTVPLVNGGMAPSLAGSTDIK